MKTASVIAVIVAAIAIGFGIYMVDIDQTEQAALPDVDVTVEGGNLPEFEANVGSVEVGTEEVVVEVPTLEVTTPEEEATASNDG